MQTAPQFKTLFNLVMDGYESLLASRDAVEKHFQIGRDIVKICFAGGAMLPVVLPAIEHLAVEPESGPDLTIHIWDMASAPQPAPLILDCLMRSISWHWEYYVSSRGELKELCSQATMASFHPGPDILSLLDIKNQRAVYWAKEAKHVPWHESGSPMRSILNWWALSQGDQMVHGGAVGLDDKAVLLVGKGGSGKSTTCLACLEAGLQYLGDDYSLVSFNGQPWVYSLYNTAKLKGPRDLERFPNLKPLLINPGRLDTEKAMFSLNGDFSRQIVSKMPLKAILIPQVTNQPQTNIRPASQAKAFAALAPSTMIQLPGSAGPAMKNMTQLVKRLPCYSLELGTDLRGVAGKVREFLSSGAA